jgi:hypothetical protein
MSDKQQYRLFPKGRADLGITIIFLLNNKITSCHKSSGCVIMTIAN